MHLRNVYCKTMHEIHFPEKRTNSWKFSLNNRTYAISELDRTVSAIYRLVMVHNPAHDLFSIGHFLCRVRHQSVQLSKSFGLQPVTIYRHTTPFQKGWTSVTRSVSVIKLELNLYGNPTGRSAFKLNGDLERFINRILGRKVQGHGLDMSWLIVALEESM